MNMEYLQLKDVCNINMGQSPDSSSYNEAGEGLPFFQGNADFGERYPITRVWSSAPIKKAKENDILISVRAPIGALNYAKELCCIGRGLAALTPNEDIVSSEFIFWMLKGKNTELNSKGTGSTFKAISKKVLEEIKVPNIDLNTQKMCSGNLEKIYKIIQLRKQQLQQLDELVKARFVELFGDVLTNEKSWETAIWNDVLTIKNGKNQKQVENPTGQYPICGSGGIMGYADNYISEANSVIIGRKGNINKPILMREKYWNVDTAFGLEPNNKFLLVDFLFLFCVLFDFEKLNKAVTIPSLTKADLLKIEMPIPPIELQNEFADFVKQIDKSKVVVQKALDEAQTLFDSLMQEYFG